MSNIFALGQKFRAATSDHINQLLADRARMEFVKLIWFSDIRLTEGEDLYLSTFFADEPNPAGWTPIQREAIDALKEKYAHRLSKTAGRDARRNPPEAGATP